jgi:hypothetical protein
MNLSFYQEEWVISSVSAPSPPRPPKHDRIRVGIRVPQGASGANALQLSFLALPGSAGAAALVSRLREAAGRIEAGASGEPVEIWLGDLLDSAA